MQFVHTQRLSGGGFIKRPVPAVASTETRNLRAPPPPPPCPRIRLRLNSWLHGRTGSSDFRARVSAENAGAL